MNEHSEHTYVKYLLHALISFLVVWAVALYFALNYQDLYESREYPMWKHVHNVVNSASSDKNQLILIGDSRAKAGYEPKYASYKTLNLALGGSTPIEGYYILKHYLENNEKPKNIVLSYAPFHLIEHNYFWLRTVRYKFLEYDQYSKIISNAYKLKNDEISENDNRLKYYLFPSTYISSIFTGLRKKRWKVNKQVHSDVLVNNGHYHFGRKDGSSELNDESRLYDKFKRSELLEFYLLKLLELAKINDIKVSWYTMPFNESSCKRISKDLVSGYNQYLNKLNKENNVTLIKRISCMDDKYFGDSSHVYKGSKLTTTEILKGVE